MTTQTDTTRPIRFATREEAETEATYRAAHGEMLECGHRATPSLVPCDVRRCVVPAPADADALPWGLTGGTGYARDPETDARMCYGCADSAQAAEMANPATDRMGLYLTRHELPGNGLSGRPAYRWTLTTWTGGVLANCTDVWESRISPSCDGFRFRATDANGGRWYGTSPGPGMYANVRRSRARRAA